MLGLWAFGAAAVVRGDGSPSRRDADQLKLKVMQIEQRAAVAKRQPARVTVTESEVNAFLALDARELLPAGVAEPAVSIVGTGRLAGRAIVDLDAVRRQKNPTSMLDPMSYLTGRLPVEATGVLRAANGVGRFELETATLSGVPIPKPVLQQIVSYYSRTPEHPAGISLDDPFPLPARIQAIEVEPGRAIIVQ